MMREEIEVKELFSDKMLVPTDKFKKQLRRQVMKTANPQSDRRRFWVLIPVAGLVVLAIAFATAQLLPGIESKVNEIARNNPFVPQPLSAAVLEGKNKEFRENLKNLVFITHTETETKGPLFAVCDRGGMGAQPGETITSYSFMSKDSGSEALYMTRRAADGATLASFSYYSPDSTRLSDIVSDNVGRAFTFEEEYYIAVDDDGNAVPGEVKYEAQKENGKYVYKVNAVARNTTGDDCQGEKVIVRYTIDATSFAYMKSERYKSKVNQANLIYTYSADTRTEQLSESTAIERMTDAGFNKSTASRELPGHINLN